MLNSSKQIKFGALLSYLSIALSVVAGLLYTPWMVEKIGKSHYGLYTLANSVITLFLMDFGLSATTSRYLAKYNAEGKREQAEKLLGAIYKLYIIVDAVIFTVLFVYFFMIDSIYVGMTAKELEEFKIVYVISALFSVVNFPFVTFNGILNAYEKFIPLKLADVLYRLFNVGFTVLALALGYGLYALVSVHAIVGLSVIVFKFVVIKKTIPLKIKFAKTDKGIYKEIFSFSIWAMLSLVAARLVFSIIPTVLGVVATTFAIAVFGIITTLESYSYTFTSAINGMFMPKISRIVAGNDIEKNLNPLLVSVGKFQYASNGLIIAGFVVLGEYFIRLWMGVGYEDAYLGLLLVLIPGIFYNSLQIANTTMVVQKRVKEQAIITIMMGVLNIALAFPLAKKYGVIGACLSICIAYVFRAIAYNVIYHKILPVNIPQFISKCYIRMSLPIIATIAFGFGLNYLIQDAGWLIFVIKVTMVCVVYLGLAFVIGLTKEEKRKVITGVIRKRK